MKAEQLELFSSDMLIDLHIGWYYGYNPDQKPYKGTIMSVCKVIDVIDTPIGQRCIIQVIGDVGIRDAHANELSPMNLIKCADITNFSTGFQVDPAQLDAWRRGAK